MKLLITIPRITRRLAAEIAVGFLIFSLGIACIFVSQFFLSNYYPNPIQPQDAVLDRLGPYPMFIIVSELAGTFSILMYWYTAYKQGFTTLPEFLTKLGLMYALRALTIVLTPLASIQPNGGGNAMPIVSNLYFGMFFSGHTASAFIIYFIDRYSGKTKLLKLISACIIALALILSHSHYSIDIIGGIMAAYIIGFLDTGRFINKIINYPNLEKNYL